MKKALIITICLMLIFVLVACGTAKPNSPAATPDNTDDNVNPSNQTPATNTVTFSEKNQGVMALGNALDNLESLEELTGVDLSVFNASATTSSDDDNELDLEGYDDYTTPGNWYYVSDSVISNSVGYSGFNNFFHENEAYYSAARTKKDEILNSENLMFLNIWYEDGDNTNRVTYNEENKDLICESIEADNTYTKLNIGRTEEGKLYYSYLCTEFDNSIPLFGGLEEQRYIEYLEDDYYNLYALGTGRCWKNGVFECYIFSSSIQEVDLSIEGGRFYCYDDTTGYEPKELKKYNYDTGEIIENNDAPMYPYDFYCFEMDNNNLIEYQINATRKMILMPTAYGLLTFQIAGGDDYYSGMLNMYEMSGIKQIKGKLSSDTDTPFMNFAVELETGEWLTSKETTDDFVIETYSRGGGTYNGYYPCARVGGWNRQELLNKMNKHNIAFKDFDLQRYLNILDNPDYMFHGYQIIPSNYYSIYKYCMSKVFVIDLEEVRKDYDNVEEIMIPIEVNITVSIEGQATVEDGVIDLFDLKLVVENVEELTEKYLNGGEICLNDNVIGTLVYDYDEKTLSVDADTVEFDLAWLNVGGENVLALRLPKLSVVLEIPYEGVFPEIEIPDEPTDETGNEPGDELGDETGDDNGDEQGTENGDENGNPDLNGGDENGGEPEDSNGGNEPDDEGDENGNESTNSNGDEDPAGTDDEDAD